MTNGSLDIDFVRQKLLSVIDQIKHLQTSEFPYQESREALKLLADLYGRELNRLSGIGPTTDHTIRQQVTAQVNAYIARYYTVLGFILRSTNVRNAFEIYDPLLRMSQTIYGPEAKLIVSSEWSFSPFTYPAITDEFPNLMFIGLPATESGNPLIVPLAGHELGHSIWRKKPHRSPHLSALDATLQSRLVGEYQNSWSEFQQLFDVQTKPADLLSDLFLRSIWARSYRLATRQIEELFCDIIGLRLFGESYLYSFIYLIAPHTGERAAYYPSLGSRVTALESAARAFGITEPPAFSGYFIDLPKRLQANEAFCLRMADQASTAMIEDLIAAVSGHVARTGLALPSDAERDRIVKQFCALSPAASTTSIGDTINAGWAIRLNWAHWKNFNFREDTRLEILNDLVFKTMEVMEFESRTRYLYVEQHWIDRPAQSRSWRRRRHAGNRAAP